MISSATPILTLTLTLTLTSSISANPSQNNTFFPRLIQFKKLRNNTNLSLQCRCSPLSSRFSAGTSTRVVDKLHLLVSEFEALTEPIDRVKRLLHFAELLPPMEESARVAENRVRGCTTQLWLTAEKDGGGRMRFRADSDSEITKGFCWCLIWIFDGAEAQEVMMVKAQDLAHINVGFNVRAQSRVNTWHNLLLSMQKATRALLLDSHHYEA